MNYSVRRLDPDKDAQAFQDAFDWLLSAPEWLQTTEVADKSSRLAFVRDPRCVCVGVFIGNELTAVVSLLLTGQHTYEVFLEAKRGTPAEVIVLAGCEIREQMFRYGMQYAYTWTPRWNRGVLAINKAIGFRPDNVSMWRGSIGNRTIEWVRYSLANPLCRAA